MMSSRIAFRLEPFHFEKIPQSGEAGLQRPEQPHDGRPAGFIPAVRRGAQATNKQQHRQMRRNKRCSSEYASMNLRSENCRQPGLRAPKRRADTASRMTVMFIRVEGMPLPRRH